MIYRVYGPIAAAPLLSLSLEHIARTPAARLGIVYQIVPMRHTLSPAAAANRALLAPNRPLPPSELAELLAARSLNAPVQLPRNLGNGLYLDSLLSGGINGQPLPLSVERRVEHYQPGPAAGGAFDAIT